MDTFLKMVSTLFKTRKILAEVYVSCKLRKRNYVPKFIIFLQLSTTAIRHSLVIKFKYGKVFFTTQHIINLMRGQKFRNRRL